MNRSSHLTKAFRSLVAAESLALLVLVSLVWMLQPEAVISVIWGGLVFFIPSAYFTFYAFRYSGTGWVGLAALSMFRGQAGKMLLTSAGFALAFKFARPLQVAYLFGGYIFLLIIHLFVAARLDRQNDLARSSEVAK